MRFKHTYVVKFYGRRVGAIGVRYPVETTVMSSWWLDEHGVLSHLYQDGWEHISKFEVVTWPEGHPNMKGGY